MSDAEDGPVTLDDFAEAHAEGDPTGPADPPSPTDPEDAAYVVSVKPSAKQKNARAGRLVFDDGPRHGFDSRPAADAWAAHLSRGNGYVWVRTANPGDERADGYLVSRYDVGRPERPPAEVGPLAVFADDE